MDAKSLVSQSSDLTKEARALEGAIEMMMGLAADRVKKKYKGIRNQNQIEACMAHEMLGVAEEMKQTYRSATAAVVTYISRHSLWTQHPSGYDDDQDGLRLFLLDAGLGASMASELASLGFKVIPFCDRHKIEINDMLAPSAWTRTREALTAIKAAIDDQDSDKVAEIVDDVRRTTGPHAKLALRDKYRDTGEKPGHGTTFRHGKDHLILIKFDTEDDAQAAIRRMGTVTEWDLPAIFSRSDRTIHLQ